MPLNEYGLPDVDTRSAIRPIGSPYQLFPQYGMANIFAPDAGGLPRVPYQNPMSTSMSSVGKYDASAADAGLGDLFKAIPALAKVFKNLIPKPDLGTGGTAGGDPLGTGALTTTSADQTRPIEYGGSDSEIGLGSVPVTPGYDNTGIEPSTWSFDPSPGPTVGGWDPSDGGGDWGGGFGGDTSFDPEGGLSFADVTGPDFDPASIGGTGGGWDLSGLTDGLDFSTAVSMVGPTLSIAGDLMGPNPGKDTAMDVGKIAAKEGLKYLYNQSGASDWVSSQLSNVGDWASNAMQSVGNLFGDAGGAAVGGGLGAEAGTIGGLVPELAGAAGADLGIGLGTGAAEAAGGLAGGIASLGAGIPIAAWATLLSSIIQDEIADPKGRVSAAQDYNYLNQQGMKDWTSALKNVQGAYGGINDQMTDDQLQNAFKMFRYGTKANELMADPMANQGQNEYGVNLTNYGSNVANLRNQAGPESVMGTIRLQDLLASRGLTPQSFESASPLGVEMAGLNYQAQNQAGATGEYTNQHMGMPSPFDAEGHLAGLGALKPADALAKLGFSQDRLGEMDIMKQYGLSANDPDLVERLRDIQRQSADVSDEGVIYDPETMRRLRALQPGGYEKGLLEILGLA